MSQLVSEELRALVAATVRDHTRSPQQEAAYEKGAAVVEAYLVSAGLAETILPMVRREVAELRLLLQQAAALRQEVAALLHPEDLDDRARRVVALCAALRRVLGEGRTDTREITRAISYIVWGYQTNGQSPPSELDADPQGDNLP